MCYIYSVRKSKGQNLVEYILLVAAVVLVCLFFYTSGIMQKNVNTSLNSIVGELNGIKAQVQF